ncbi:MAG: dTMP kinase [Rikenellaceae bacterium]|nr:dTMP kinase [Rikenellaceae bacterium]
MAFIVLEGLDGAGKSTQIRQLQHWLTEKGLEYAYIHFPRFDTPVYGDLIARFLRSELGGIDQVNPYLVALIYAGDRKEAAPVIRHWLEQGKVVIIDRYVCSNIAYQCAKISDPAEKAALRKWILNLEYSLNGIPRPDITLFLDVPFAFTEKSLSKNREGHDRDYLNGKEDIHEASLDLQQAVRQVYLEEAEHDPTVQIVHCSGPEGQILAPEQAFAKIKENLFTIL